MDDIVPRPPSPSAQAAPPDAVAATAHHIRAVISALDALELGDTPPAPVYDARQGVTTGATI
ncbi:hypothetical protein [Streptomyces sp. NPDC046261]|uniref:hypothetical protein n=1 Tax=Streptomyces sp. NPDC046261 TaxID=3157200 RepID=UPI0033F9AD6B